MQFFVTIVRSVPLFLLAVLAYFTITLFIDDLHAIKWTFVLPSTSLCLITLGDLIVGLSLFILFIEIVKATRTGFISNMEHILSALLFVGCLSAFLVLPSAATGTFFLITLMSFIDVIAGFTVSIAGSRRDFGVDTHVFR